MLSKLIIVTDLHHFKLFTRNIDPKGRISLHLNVSKNSLNLHKKAHDELSDRDGNFHGIAGSGTGENHHAKLEKEHRRIKEISEEISIFLQDYPHEKWSFAAPQAINNQIIDLLPSSIKNNLVSNVYADLTNIPTDELLDYF